MDSHQVQIEPGGAAERPPESGALLEVLVLYTDIPSTLAALGTATQLAQGLDARIRVLALQTVPYPLALTQPAVNVQFLTSRLRTLAVGSEVETIADICLCRDEWEALQSRLAPKSVLVIGRRSRWWPQREDRLARKLREAGHHVVRTTLHKEPAHA